MTTSLWGHVTEGSMSVVIMLLYSPCPSGEQVSGGHVTVSNRPLVAMSLWGPCHSGQRDSAGHVTQGGMSQWAADQL